MIVLLSLVEVADVWAEEEEGPVYGRDVVLRHREEAEDLFVLNTRHICFLVALHLAANAEDTRKVILAYGEEDEGRAEHDARAVLRESCVLLTDAGRLHEAVDELDD